MLRRTLLCATILLLLFVKQPISYGADPVRQALPPGSKLVASTGLPGYPGWYAVAYHLDQYYLGVISVNTIPKLRWQHRLVGDRVALTTPGDVGVFQASVTNRNDTSVRLLAYRVRGTRVESAIADDPSGLVRGDEGITVRGDAFTVRARDRSHNGSVNYRIVTRYSLQSGLYRVSKKYTVPDYPKDAYPVPDGVVTTGSANTFLVRLEVASTDQQRQLGLMNRKSLDPDSGMIFVWTDPILESFWMDNTYIPLSIAFLDLGGKIQEIQDMQPLTTDLHTPVLPYLFAIEVNQGYFRDHGIQVGDKIALHLTS